MFSSSSSSLSLDSSEGITLKQRRDQEPASYNPKPNPTTTSNSRHPAALSSSSSTTAAAAPPAHRSEDPTWLQRQARGASGSASRDESPHGVTAAVGARPRAGRTRHRSPPPPGLGAADRGANVSRKKVLTSEDIDELVQQQYRLYGSDSPSPSKDRVVTVAPTEDRPRRKKEEAEQVNAEGEEPEEAGALLAEHHFVEDRPNNNNSNSVTQRQARDDQLVRSSPRRSPASAAAALDGRDSAAYLQLYQSSLTSMGSSANTSRGECSPPSHEMLLSALTEEMERLGLNEDDARAPSVAPAPTPSPASSPIPKTERDGVEKVLPLTSAGQEERKEAESPSPTRQRFERTPSPHSYIQKDDRHAREAEKEEGEDDHDVVLARRTLSPPQQQRDADVVDSPRPAEPKQKKVEQEEEEEDRRRPSSRRSLFPDEKTATEPRETSKSHTVEPPRRGMSSSSSLPHRGASHTSSASLMEVTVEEVEPETEKEEPSPSFGMAAAVSSPLTNVRWVTPATGFTDRGEINTDRRLSPPRDEGKPKQKHEDRYHNSSVLSIVSSSAFCGPAASGLLAAQYTPLAADVRPPRREEREGEEVQYHQRQQHQKRYDPNEYTTVSSSRIRFSSFVNADPIATTTTTTAGFTSAGRPQPEVRYNGTVALRDQELTVNNTSYNYADASTTSSANFTQPWQRWSAGATRRNTANLDGALHTGGGTNKLSHAVVSRQYHVHSDTYRTYAHSEDDYFYPTELERVTGRTGTSGAGVLGPRARVTAVLEARDRYASATSGGEPSTRKEATRTPPPPPPQGEKKEEGAAAAWARAVGQPVPFVYSPQRQAAIITTNTMAAAADRAGATTRHTGSDSRLLSPHFVLRPSMAAAATAKAEVRRPLQFGGEDTPGSHTSPPPPKTPAATTSVATTKAQPSTSAFHANGGGSHGGRSAVRFSGNRPPQQAVTQRADSSPPKSSRDHSSPPRAARTTAVPLQQVPLISYNANRERSTSSSGETRPKGRLSAEQIADLKAQERNSLMDMYKRQKAQEAGAEAEEAAERARRGRTSGGTVSVSLSTPRCHSPAMDELVETSHHTTTTTTNTSSAEAQQQQQQQQQQLMLRSYIQHNLQQTQLLEQQRIFREETVHRARVELLADHGVQEVLREMHFCETVAMLRQEAAAAAAAHEQSTARAAEETAAEQEEEKKRVLRRVRREQCELASELESLSRELQSLVKQ